MGLFCPIMTKGSRLHYWLLSLASFSHGMGLLLSLYLPWLVQLIEYSFWKWLFLFVKSRLCIRHFTSTLVVTSHNIKACSVFLPLHISALYVLAPRPRDQLSAKNADVTSLPKILVNAVSCIVHTCFVDLLLVSFSGQYVNEWPLCTIRFEMFPDFL